MSKDTLDPRALLEGTTPGDWRIYQRRLDDGASMQIDAPSGRLASINFWKDHEANARLIAAAPQLAQACIAKDERIAAVQRVRNGYASQAKFADIDCAVHFREFVRRIDAALTNKGAAA